MEKKMTVTFLDCNNIRCKIEIERRYKQGKTGRNWDTLEECLNEYEYSFCGEYGSLGLGQIYDHIGTANAPQKRLVELWKKYHCAYTTAGTKKQMDFLRSAECDAMWDKINAHIGQCNVNKCEWDVASLAEAVGSSEVQAAQAVVDKLFDNGLQSYHKNLGRLDRWDKASYKIHCLLLAFAGLYEDRGYAYGMGWLCKDIPADLWEQLERVCRDIEAIEEEEEEEVTYDFGDESLEITAEIVAHVAEMMGYTTERAEYFCAVAKELAVTYEELAEEIIVYDDNRFSAYGMDYWVGKAEQLENCALSYMDDTYEELWRDSVAVGRTLLGFEEWCESILRNDGWESVLNHYDGTSEEYKIAGKAIYVAREN